MIKVGKLLNIRDIGLRDAQSHLPILSDHGIGAEPAVTRQIEHIRGLREQEDVKACLFHQSAASF